MRENSESRVFASWAMTALLLASCGQQRGVEAPPPEPVAASSEESEPEGEADPSEAQPQASPTPTPEPSGDSTTRTWDFDRSTVGELPESFTEATGRWRVADDDTAPSGTRVLAQDASGADDVFNVVLIDGTTASDVDLTVRLRSVSGRVDQGGGLVWRAQDARNYYIARYNPLEDNFRVYVVRDGRRRMLETATLRLDHAAWHTLRVVMTGPRIECYLDGTLHLEASDSTLAAEGLIGLWTKADARTHFDDLLARSVGPAGEE